MSLFLRTIAHVSETLWTLSWQVTVLVGLVWAASLLFRRAAPSFRYFLWCIVLVRLCLPVVLTSPFGVAGDVKGMMGADLRAGLPAGPSGTISPDNSAPTGFAATSASVEEKGLERPQDRQTPLRAPLNVWLGLGWLAAAAGCAVLVVTRSAQVHGRVKRYAQVTRPDLLKRLAELRTRCGVRRTVPMRQFPEARGTAGPAVIGIFQPVIVLPQSMAERWSPDDLEPILLHELAHLKRRDLPVNLIQIIVQVIYFFHPLVWYANARIRQERELACDDLAVLHSGTGGHPYSRGILRVLEETAMDAPRFGMAALGMAEQRSFITKRIARMVNDNYRPKGPTGWLSLVAVAILAIAGMAVASGSGDASPEVKALKEAYSKAEQQTPPFALEMAQYDRLDSFDADVSGLTPASVKEFARKGQSFRYAPKPPTTSPAGFVVRDGETVSSYDESMSTLFNEKDSDWNIYDNPIPFMLRVWNTPLARHIQQDSFTLSEKTETLDGKECKVFTGTQVFSPSVLQRAKKLVLEGSLKAGSRLEYRIYLDPTIGMMPRRVEELSPQGGVNRTLTLRDYKEIAPGCWFPQRMEELGAPKPNAKKQLRNLYLVKSVEVKQDLPDSLFTIQVPPDTKVVDE